MGSVFTFDRALVREPAASVSNGLRAGDHSGPAFEDVLAEHRAYFAALAEAELAVEVLPALPDYPDSIFVEDPAFVMPEGAIVLRSGAPSRQGEGPEIAPALGERFERVLTLDVGYVDGGDILVLRDEILVGLSGRTDRAGAGRFAELAGELGYEVRIVQPPPGVLHLKSACSLIDEGTLLATPALARSGMFDGLEIVATAPGEEAAANALRLNDRLLISAGYPRTAEMLAGRGIDIVCLNTAAIQKLDAGLSCMSLRWESA